MKKLSRIISAVVTMAIVMSCALVPAFAADILEEDMGLEITSETTWGDFYRHFEPDEFESFPIDVQEMYDSLLYANTNSQNSTPAIQYIDGEGNSTTMEYEEIDGEMEIVGIKGHLAPDFEVIKELMKLDESDLDALLEAEVINENLLDLLTIDIDALYWFTAGVTPKPMSMDYACILGITMNMPRIAISLVLTDQVTGTAVGWDSKTASNATYAKVDDTWTGLYSNRKYSVNYMGWMEMPNDGKIYLYTGPYYLSQTTTTK